MLTTTHHFIRKSAALVIALSSMSIMPVIAQSPTPTTEIASAAAAQAAVSSIQLVQANVAGTESTAPAISATFTSSNVAGNLLVVMGTAARPSSTLTIADTAGDSFTAAIGPVNDPAQNVNAYIWYVPVAKGGANTVTITPATAGALEIHISEYSGAASSTPLDKVSWATGNSANASSGAATTLVNGELVYGYSFVAPTTSSPGSGFTGLSLVNGDWDEYAIQTSAGSTAATFTLPSGGWLALMATFQPRQASPVLSVSPTYVQFEAAPNGSNPAPSSVSVTNTGGGTLSFTASSDSGWLTVSPTTGAAPQQLQLSASISGVPLGMYTGHVTVTAAGAQGSPAVITVVLNVGAANDWLMVDHDPGRSGNAVDETTLTNANAAGLQLSWSTIVDGAVTAQPLFVHSVLVGGQTRDVVIVATGKNSLYALDSAGGAVLWTRNFGPTTAAFGLPEGFGIEAPPVVDRDTARIYAVSTDGSFRTISLSDGSDVYAALPFISNPATNKVWGGLNKVGNSVYVATGSNGGDVAPWRGQVYQIDVSAAPAVIGNFVVVSSIAAPNGGGGIWGYGGVSADGITGTIYAASAFDSNIGSNGNEGTTPNADSVIALDSRLRLLGAYQPAQPSTFNCAAAPCDLDFASTPLFFQPSGCPTMVATGNKNGNLYLFRTADLRVSGQPTQVLTLNTASDSIGLGGINGVAAFSPANNMVYVTDAGAGVAGVAAGVVGLKVTSSCTLQVAWSQQLGGGLDIPNSTPTIANGVVFVGEGKTGILHAYDAISGNQLWQSGADYTAAATYAAPIVAGGKLYAGSWSSSSGGGIVGAFSLSSGLRLQVSPATVSFTAVIGGANPAPATLSVSNSGTGSLSFSAQSDSAWLGVAPTSGTAPQSLQASASIAGLSPGTYTGHITVTAAGAQGSPATVTATLTVSASGGSGPAIDASASRDNGSAAASVTSPLFSTTASNELLLAFVATDKISAPNVTVTSVTGGGVTWALAVRANAQSGTAEIWRAFASTQLTNVSVTANLSQSVTSSLEVVTFSGVDASGINGSGAIGATASASAASGAPTGSLTTTRNNSWVVAVGNDYDNAISRTIGPGQTLIHQFLSPNNDTYWMQRRSAATPVAGTLVTINDTAPGTDRYNLALAEVLPAGVVVPTYSVAGTVSPLANGPGTVLQLTGGAAASVTADTSGNYSFSNLANGTYTVTPSKTGFTFSPTSQTLTINGANLSGVNFTATPIPTYTIAGTVSPLANGPGTVLQLTGGAAASVTADTSGNYSFSNLANGTYTVTPSKTGFTFSPTSRTLTINGANLSGVNFTAVAAPPGLATDVRVSTDGASASTSITSPTFSTAAANELLLAFVATDYISGASVTVNSVTGGGVTWVLAVRSNTQSGTSEIWRALAPTQLTSATVTAAVSQKVVASLTVMSFTGVDTSGTNGSGAIGATRAANASSGAPTASLVTTRNNSWVIGVGNDWDRAIARTPGPGQSIVHQDLVAVGDTYWVQMQNNPTPTTGTTVTINDTAPTTDRYNLAICEILPK